MMDTSAITSYAHPKQDGGPPDPGNEIAARRENRSGEHSKIKGSHEYLNTVHKASEDRSCLVDVAAIFAGSDGSATKSLYSALRSVGPIGAVAAELLRAQKSSDRAKQYRGGIGIRGSYRDLAYDRKQTAIDKLCSVLMTHDDEIALSWGWGIDNAQPFHKHVLYVDLPAGQVSFHSGVRGAGPDYVKSWDGIRGVSAYRILTFAADLLLDDFVFVDVSEVKAERRSKRGRA